MSNLHIFSVYETLWHIFLSYYELKLSHKQILSRKGRFMLSVDVHF